MMKEHAFLLLNYREIEMKYTKDELLNRMSLDFIGEIVKASNFEKEERGLEEEPELIRENMVRQIKQTMRDMELTEKQMREITDQVDTLVESRETLYFIYGVRAGAKLMREMAFGD